jgi:hypothetical protein
MNEQQTQAPGEHRHATCLCCQVMDRVRETIGVKSEPVRQHLRNSRIEFLKAIRTVIDERINYLSRGAGQQGTKVTIE